MYNITMIGMYITKNVSFTNALDAGIDDCFLWVRKYIKPFAFN